MVSRNRTLLNGFSPGQGLLVDSTAFSDYLMPTFFPPGRTDPLKTKLALENGTVFTGEAFGSHSEATGEVVFNTSMTGYQEILTDPSYAGQIVTMTYPQIGNYGVNLEDLESVKPQVGGFIVKEYFDFYSNFRARMSLGDWLEEHAIPGIQGIDTRMLTKMIRKGGALRGILSTDDLDDKSLIAKARRSPEMKGLDLTKQVTTKEPYRWEEIDETPFALQPVAGKSRNGKKWHVKEYVIINGDRKIRPFGIFEKAKLDNFFKSLIN